MTIALHSRQPTLEIPRSIFHAHSAQVRDLRVPYDAPKATRLGERDSPLLVRELADLRSGADMLQSAKQLRDIDNDSFDDVTRVVAPRVTPATQPNS